MKNKIKRVFIVGLITYILIEITCFIFIKTGYIGAKLPQFFTDPLDTVTYPFTYADVNEHWGIWHYNYPAKVQLGEITLECNPNSVGARDKERTRTSTDTNRIVVLGDSFIEGYGVSENKRVSNLLEAATGHEFLNFGCSDMGNTQEYLVYKHLASGYSHNTILWGILPVNDFMNDNSQFYESQSPLRYKPYWKGSYPNKELYYYTDSLNKTQFNYEAFKKYKSTKKYKVRHVLENITCWFNIVYFLAKKKGAADVVAHAAKTGMPYTGYYDYSQQDFDQLKQSLHAVRTLAPHKRIIVFTIPIAADFHRFITTRQTPPLVKQLQEFCTSENITYTDLMTTATPTDLQQYKKQFFKTDMHWNDYGNEWAAKKLLPYFIPNK